MREKKANIWQFSSEAKNKKYLPFELNNSLSPSLSHPHKCHTLEY